MCLIRFLSEHKKAGAEADVAEDGGDEPATSLSPDVTLSHFEFLNSEEAREALSKESISYIESTSLKLRAGNTDASLDELEQQRFEQVLARKKNTLWRLEVQVGVFR